MESASQGSSGVDVRTVECDAERTTMIKELKEFGFNEDDVCKMEMKVLLKALRYSKCSAEKEHRRSQTNERSESTASNHKPQRRYKMVADRRLPWCLLPSNLTTVQKEKCLTAYNRLLSINQYRKSRSLTEFKDWAPPIAISTGGSGRALSASTVPRTTRSGRFVPSYDVISVDDDSNDKPDDLVKPKKSKVSKEISSSNELAVYSNRTSLKRKTNMADCPRPEKETRVEVKKGVSRSSADSADKDQDEIYVWEDIFRH